MELKGKKIAFLGDSITQGCCLDDISDVYWNEVARRTGAQVFGYGIGGTRIAEQRNKPSWDPAADQYFGSRVDTMIPDADAVVIFGGTNDFGHGDAALGTMADRGEDTFYGAYHRLIEKVYTHCPDAKLLIMTPTHRLSENDMPYNEGGLRRMGTLRDYVRAIREIAEYYGISVVDLFATCPMQPKIEAQRLRYMPDGLHPNAAGHKLIADRLIPVLKEL